MKKLKYKVEEDLTEKQLNEIGNDGWELVSVVYEIWDNERKGYQEDRTVFYFKR